MSSGSLQLPDPKPLSGGTLPIPHVFVADAAFPMSLNLMRPFPSGSKELSQPARKIYDYRHSRARYAARNPLPTVPLLLTFVALQKSSGKRLWDTGSSLANFA